MRVLLIGGSGQLGSEIRRRWSGDRIVAPGHDTVDLAVPASMDAAIAGSDAEVVVNCAAFHNVDRCESEVETALRMNAVAVERLAELCAQSGKRFVTISTDYVFDGTTEWPYSENDCAHPISAYGLSKYAGELLVERLRSDALVVRTCGVYGVRPSATKGYTFIDRLIAQARAGERGRVVSDVVASPTYAGHLAEALRALLETNARGVVHACNVGPVSWYDFAAEALRQAGIDAPLDAISSGEWKAGARRPRYSALENTRLRELGITMPDWREAIAAYFADKASRQQ